MGLREDIAKQRVISLKGSSEGLKELLKQHSQPTRERTPLQQTESPQQKAYRALLEKNPLLAELVDRLELEAPALEALPTPPPPAPPVESHTEAPPPAKAALASKGLTKKKKTLEEIAQGLLEPFNHYSEADIIQRIAKDTRANKERSMLALKEMIRQEIIEENLPNKYHLSSSTPF